MSEDRNTPNTEAKAAAPAPAEATAAAPAPAGWHTWMAAAGAVLALAAWVTLCFNGYAALGVGLAAFAACIPGLHAHTRAWRNLATTALIASGVIIVVLTAFLIVIFWGLNSI